MRETDPDAFAQREYLQKMVATAKGVELLGGGGERAFEVSR